MNIRKAILKAADSIEKHEDQYRFGSIDIPDGCGTPGCALGWIGHHLGWKEEEYVDGDFFDSISKVLGIEHHNRFYDRMDDIGPEFFALWTPQEAADGLRKYADVWHPAQRAERSLPESVLAIFEERIAA